MTWNEADLAAIGKIQERRNCTIDNAKRVYRMHVNKRPRRRNGFG